MIGHAISVRPTRLGHGLAGTEAIRDLIIEHNEFQDCGGAALFIGDASNVAVSNNRIHAAPDAERRRKAPRDPGRTQFPYSPHLCRRGRNRSLRHRSGYAIR